MHIRCAIVCASDEHMEGSESMKTNETLNETEKRVMERLVKVLPTLSDFDKGYILGKVEQTAEKRREEKRKRKNFQ